MQRQPFTEATLYAQARVLCDRLMRHNITADVFQDLMTAMVIVPYSDYSESIGLRTAERHVEWLTDTLVEQLNQFINNEGSKYLFSLTSSGSFLTVFDPENITEALESR